MSTSTIETMYWLTSGAVALWMAAAAISIFLNKEFIHHAIVRLGYPAYFPYLLGTAKAIGMLFILLPVAPQLKLISYAGAGFELIAATVSYYVVDRKFSEWIKPVVLLALVATAYIIWEWRQQLIG